MARAGRLLLAAKLAYVPTRCSRKKGWVTAYGGLGARSVGLQPPFLSKVTRSQPHLHPYCIRAITAAICHREGLSAPLHPYALKKVWRLSREVPAVMPHRSSSK